MIIYQDLTETEAAMNQANPADDDLDVLDFYIEELPEGGFVARSYGACMMTSGETLEELQRHIREALCCHFDDGCEPQQVRLRYIQVTKEELVVL